MHLRRRHLQDIRRLFEIFPIVALLGPRQVGKTTLAHQFASTWSAPSHHFDLEDPEDLARLSDPAFVLRPLHGLVILDEIQVRPDLFPLLRVLADRPETPARFLILGSAAPELIRHTAETLAGRVGLHELGGFDLEEVGVEAMDALWLRGGFPRAFLAADDAGSQAWRQALIRTYLERDLPQLGIRLPAQALRRFWTMLAHYHGQTWNGSELARAMAVTDKTVLRYLEILEGTFMAWRLRPWHANVGKREIKAPKVYLADSGLLHSLLGIESTDGLLAHPKCGASWEGFALREVMRRLGLTPREVYFWGLHSGAELDMLVVKDRRRLGFEVKLTRSPRMTPAMRSALEILELEHLYVVCHGAGDPWPLADRISALPLASLGQLEF